MGASSDRLLTVAQLADRWGWSRQKIYRLVYAKQIPYVRIGTGRGGIYFEEATIDAWLETKRNAKAYARADAEACAVALAAERRRGPDAPRDWGLPVKNVFGL